MTAELGLAPDDARAITDRIKVAVEAAWGLIKEAYTGRAWASLGYESWDEYCGAEFGTSRLRLPREERQQVVSSMREIGMSTRAIAVATGVSQPTVSRQLAAGDSFASPAPVIGTDGKTYSQPSKPPTPRLISASDLAALNTPRPVPIVDPAPLTPEQREVAAAEAFLAADPAIRRARFAKDFVDVQGGVLAITQFDPAKVADALDVDDWDTTELMFTHFEKWVKKLRSYRHPGLRIVGGKDV